MQIIVLPGAFITSSVFSATNVEKIIGSGLEKRHDGIYAVVPGILHETPDKIWIASSNKRYIPQAGDRVLGTIVTRVGDYYRVDIGSADLALLSFLSFEGVTKRNRPTIRIGDLIYGQIILTSKHMEPEISCVDSERKGRGMGVITIPGLTINVSLNHARRLLSTEDDFLSKLGEKIKFEIIIGMNGRIWLTGQQLEVLTIRDAIIEDETTYAANRDLLIAKTFSQI